MSSGDGAGSDQQPAQGRRLQPFLVAVCIDARERSGASLERVADLAGVTAKSVDRFEKGETWPDRHLEAYVAAYAAAADIDDARDLFELALKWWHAHGAKPLLPREQQEEEGGRVAAGLIQAIRRAEEHDRARAQAEARPTSTRKKRAA